MDIGLKQFDKLINTEDLLGLSCDGINCQCKHLNTEEEKA